MPALSGAGAYYMGTYNTVPVYEAEATLFIADSPNESEDRATAVYGDILSAQNAMRNYSELIKSKSFIKEALDQLNLAEYPTERFVGNISIIFSERTSFVAGIRVRDIDPVLATDMANKLSEIFVDRMNTLMKMSVVRNLDIAEIPSSPMDNRTGRNVGIAAMAGMIFAAVIIFIVEYTGTMIIRSKEDIKKYLDMQVLAVVPKTKYIKTLNSFSD
jgi:capsular polysaccharide biosynthesis protein